MSATSSKITNIAQFVDEQPLGPFIIGLVALSLLITIWEGYDLLAAANAAPRLVADWHIHPAQLGPVFSASPFGLLLGAPLLGWLGDRIGRRNTVMIGVVIFGVFTLLCATAHTIPMLAAFRFAAGIGLGGMLPSIMTLNAEFTPRRIRATCLILINLGLTVGSILPGAFVAVVPEIGWRTIYIVGGIAPLFVLLAMFLWLPESMEFLALKRPEKNKERIVAQMRKMRPDLDLSAEQISISPAVKVKTGVGELMRDGMVGITLLLWLLFILVLATNYFLYSWMPIVFHSNGFTTRESALTTVFYYIGGLIGSLIVSRFLDRRHFNIITIFLVLACPAIGCIGITGLPHAAVSVLVFTGGFFIFGVLLGLNAFTAMIYPARIRSTGTGWAYGIGRIGGITSPMIGAHLLHAHIPIAQLFVAPAIPMGIGAVLCFILMRVCLKRFGGYHFKEADGNTTTMATAGFGGEI